MLYHNCVLPCGECVLLYECVYLCIFVYVRITCNCVLHHACVCVCAELVMEEECMVREEPRSGPGRRVRTVDIGQVSVGCMDGLTCTQTGRKRYECQNRTECECILIKIIIVKVIFCNAFRQKIKAF